MIAHTWHNVIRDEQKSSRSTSNYRVPVAYASTRVTSVLLYFLLPKYLQIKLMIFHEFKRDNSVFYLFSSYFAIQLESISIDDSISSFVLLE